MSVRKGLFFLILFPLAAWAQGPQGVTGNPLGNSTRTLGMYTWEVFGRATNPKGDPLGDVTVRLDVGAGMNTMRALKTNLQGEFQTEFTLNADTVPDPQCEAGRQQVRLRRST